MNDESFNCKDIVAEFVKSFGDDIEACTAECLQREHELVINFQEYARRIGYLMSDRRYIPIIAMRNIGTVCYLGFPDDDGSSGNTLVMTGGVEGIKQCVKRLKKEIKEKEIKEKEIKEE